MNWLPARRPLSRRPIVRRALRLERLDERNLPSNTFIGVGAASSLGLLAFNRGSLVIQDSHVTGPVGLGAQGKGLGQNSSVNGAVLVDPTAYGQFSQQFNATGGIMSQDLSQAVNDANVTSGYWAQLAATQTFNNFNQSTTLNGNGGFNIVSVLRTFDFRNDVLTLNGTTSDVFVFNIRKDFVFQNSRVALVGGLTADHVLFNLTSAGAQATVRNSHSVFIGTLLAPAGTVDYRDSASFSGAILARSVSLRSGANLDNGAPAATAGTASVSGTVFDDIDFSGTQDPGEGGLGGVTLHLTGTDDQGHAVDLTVQTDDSGHYSFTGLRAGTYTLTEDEPALYVSSSNHAGSAGGTVNGDVISGIVLGNGQQADGYTFGEVF